MKRNNEFGLSRRKVLGGLGMIGIASAGAGLGTTAYFSDEESFENNVLTAGSLDLRVDWEEHYWDDFDLPEDLAIKQVENADEVQEEWVGLPDPENPMIAVHEDDLDAFMDATSIEAFPDSIDNGIQDDLEHYDACLHFAQLDDDLDPINGGYEVTNDGVRTAKRTNNDDTLIDGETIAPLINLHDIKPGDFGELTLSFHLCDNPGYIWLQGEPVRAAENGHTEPEGESDNEDGDADEVAEGSEVLQSDVELLDKIETLVWYDEDGDNVFEPGGETGEDADIVLVLDRSGSMSGTPLSDAKDASNALIDQLGANDQIGIVSFNNNVSLDQELTLDKQDAKDAVDSLSSGGTTNLGGGVQEGHDELTSSRARTGAEKIMVVLSDGVPNTGPDSEDAADAAKGDDIRIFTIGFGGADMTLLEAMASDPDDAFEASESGELINIFSQIGQILVGEEAFFRGTLRELLGSVSDGVGIPLDGERSTPFDELGDPDDHENRDPFVNSTNNFVGLAWWVPRSVGNEIQSDSVSFDLGFYAEQSRHNDGSASEA